MFKCYYSEVSRIFSSLNLNKSIAIFLADRPYSILSIVALVTLLLIFPLFLLAPDEQASSNPPGEVYELQKEICLLYTSDAADE